jgi:hypothetical protein
VREPAKVIDVADDVAGGVPADLGFFLKRASPVDPFRFLLL